MREEKKKKRKIFLFQIDKKKIPIYNKFINEKGA